MKFQIVIALLLSMLLTSCGGGGNGGDSKASSFSASFSPYSIAGTVVEGQNQYFDIVASGNGNTGGTVYVQVLLDGVVMTDASWSSVDNNKLLFRLSVSTTLAPGDYTGDVSFLACSDAQCAHTLGDSPYKIPFNIHVAKAFKLSSNAINISAESGAIPEPQQIAIQYPELESYSDYEVLANSEGSESPWMHIEKNADNSFSVRFDTARPNTYNGTIVVKLGDGNQYWISLPVQYTINEPPGGAHDLGVDIHQLNLVTGELGSVHQVINVTLPTWSNQLEFNHSFDTPWMTIKRLSETQFDVIASAAALERGNYSAWLNFSSGYTSTSQSVNITFQVGAGMTVTPAVSILLDGHTKPEELYGALLVKSTSETQFTWTATAPNGKWIKIKRLSGTTGEALEYSFDKTALENLPNWGPDEVETIIVSGPSGNVTSQAIRFTVTKRMPGLTSVMPYIHPANTESRMILRGRGFDTLDNPAASIATTGMPLTSVTRLNDHEIAVIAQMQPAGRYHMTMTNPAGFIIGSVDQLVADTPAYGYQSIPTSGNFGNVIYDAERNAIYVANRSQKTVDRFYFNGNLWQKNSVRPDVYSLSDIVMMEGGKYLAAMGGRNGAFITRINLDSFVAVAETSLDRRTQLNVAGNFPAISLSHGGAIWLSTTSKKTQISYASSDYYGISWPPADIAGDYFVKGNWSFASASGEKVIFNDLEPGHPAVYKESGQMTPGALKAPVEFKHLWAINEDGSRVVADNSNVYDRQWNLLGTVPVAARGSIASAFSADGSKLYSVAIDMSATSLGMLVHIIDTSSPLVSNSELPEIGQFTVADIPACHLRAPDCDPSSKGFTSLDGKTLFVFGTEKLIIAPIPDNPGMQPLKVRPPVKTIVWPSQQKKG